MRTAIYIAAFIILSIAIAFTIRSTNIEKIVLEKKKSEKREKKDKSNDESSDVIVLKKWNVPPILKEISALTYMENNRFACVQDEAGKIFIYNTQTEKIEKQIPFADSGDYEGLAIAAQTAYVLRADGTIFEVKNFMSGKPATIEHNTHLTAKQDTEGMCFDSKNNRLLIAIKDLKSKNDDYKGIYAFSLSNYKLDETPVFKINLKDQVFENVKSKKTDAKLKPSAIAIHPKNGDIYITEGTKPKLLILDPTGNIKTLKKLNNKDFNQPEGISFSPDGNMYISNEGGDEPGNILEIKNL